MPKKNVLRTSFYIVVTVCTYICWKVVDFIFQNIYWCKKSVVTHRFVAERGDNSGQNIITGRKGEDAVVEVSRCLDYLHLQTSHYLSLH